MQIFTSYLIGYRKLLTTFNAPNQDPVYRKVAIVENFFDIIYTVHVELEGRPGKHAGQKRTYRTITETYAFLPREAVTRFLTGCAECARRPRSASPPPLPTPSPSPTRHPTYLPFLPQCSDYSRNWESEIDAAQNFPYDYEMPKKIESPKLDAEEPEPTYIELTSKKNFDGNNLYNSPVEPAFREEEPVRTDPEIDKDDNSLIDVEDVKCDSPPPLQKEEESSRSKEDSGRCTRAAESGGVNENKTEAKKEKKYNPLDVANLTAKDPPKSRSPPRKKLLPSSIEYPDTFRRVPKPWRPDGGVYYGGEEMDYSVPITTAYLKHMRSMTFQERTDVENKDNLTPEPADMNDDDNFSSRNGEMTESGADSMADLWASYHSALGLGSKPPKAPTPLAQGHSSPIHVGSATPGVEPASTHDETSSSDRTKDDDDAGASDDDSDDRVDPQHHDPERLKAFNMFVRLFVDENLDRIVPISKQPKEKIQAIIDSCTRQFPEFAERARKRIRTYLKSCRRNKKVRGDGPTTGNGSSTPSGNAWDSAVRPTPAHLTSVQAEHILAQACENESLNAKRMRLGLDPVSQPMPTVPTPMAIDTTATSAVASSFLSLYSGAISSPASTPTTSTSSLPTAGHSKAAADTTRPSASPTMENALLNNNSLKLDNANGNTGSKTASPASSPAPLFRPSFPNTFGTPQTFGRQPTSTNPASALTSSALLSTLTALPPTGVGVNAAMAAYQSALLSAMAAHTHTFPSNISAPTDLSLKNTATPTSLHATSTVSSLAANTATSTSKTPLLSHKLSGAEVGAVRQLITGYRESAAFLLRSADELEALLLNQP
ncbi:hypothetical protein ABMA28_009444 [Loxostege sticticalis]|uniref:Nucleolar protein 4 helical domain-containing protein n=1 Tax=Loxostege sticticalis TaxID=481309 RepID=A0ABD0SFH7_LOXSC